MNALWRVCMGAACLGVVVPTGVAELNLGSEQFVQAAGVDIVVPGYSVPSFVFWNGDDLPDLVVGEGMSGYDGKVRYYINDGALDAPHFGAWSYAQSNGADLVVPAAGCLGAFPRMVYWDADARKDLLVGQGDGKVKLFLNIGTDDAPTFDGGAFLQVGQPGSKIDIAVGARATPSALDWNNDGKKDLLVGALDGKVRIYINEGTDTAPDFRVVAYAQSGGADLSVPTGRSSPVIRDLDGDGKKDLLVGNTEGQLLFYRNTGSDGAPSFSGYIEIQAAGVPINLPGTPRSRPFVCDWTGDGLLDVLIGSGDGKVRLYQGLYEPGDLNCDGSVNNFDITPFVLALTATPPDYPEYYAAYADCFRDLGDINGDGHLDNFDITPFVALLAGG